MNIKTNLKEFFRSKTFFIVLYVLLGAAGVVVVFAAGMSIGSRRAHYDQAWRNHYLENFGPMGQPPIDHGTIGKILSVTLPRVIVEDRSGIEKTIVITADTNIRNGALILKSSDLTPDEFIVAIGDPGSNGQIEARFIRILPAPNHL